MTGTQCPCPAPSSRAQGVSSTNPLRSKDARVRKASSDPSLKDEENEAQRGRVTGLEYSASPEQGPSRMRVSFLLIIGFLKYIFIWLLRVLAAACEIFIVACGIFSCSTWGLAPDQGSNPGPLHWERGVLTTGPPGKSQNGGFLLPGPVP